MTINEHSDSLTHYGVKGMRWGIRRKKNRPDVKKMSDQELRQQISRLNLENQYSNLTRPQKSAARKLAEEIIRENLKNAASKRIQKGLDAGISVASDLAWNNRVTKRGRRKVRKGRDSAVAIGKKYLDRYIPEV